MIHGGDTLTYKDYYEGELIDYSSNINPLGPPQGLYEKLIEGFSSLNSYPDIHYRELKASVADYLNCKIENVMVGNGAVELINNFIMEAKRVLVFTPAFAEYGLRAQVHKKELVSLPYNNKFEIDPNILGEKVKKRDLLILGNPNNPTGLRIDKDRLLQIYRLVKDREAYLLLDEAFFEFCPKDYDSIELFKDDGYKNVGIIRAATKFFGLPGIRLGYACAAQNKVDQLRKIELPWSVNSLGDIAGQFIFKDKEYIKISQAYIEKERNFVFKRLGEIKGIRPYKTHTNYMLIGLENWDEDYLFNYFLRRGIVIRKCSSFIGLDKSYIRIAIKDRENNIQLLEGFENLIKK